MIGRIKKKQTSKQNIPTHKRFSKKINKQSKQKKQQKQKTSRFAYSACRTNFMGIGFAGQIISPERDRNSTVRFDPNPHSFKENDRIGILIDDMGYFYAFYNGNCVINKEFMTEKNKKNPKLYCAVNICSVTVKIEVISEISDLLNTLK